MIMQDKKSEYLRINEKGNAMDSLHCALEFLKETKKDIYRWKWFIIAIHHATYHFMLLALVNTDLSGIWQEPVMKKQGRLVDIFNSKNKLISFMEAFDYIRDLKRMSGYVNSQPFKALPYHIDSMKHLNDKLRNKFIHYKPLGWSIHGGYLIGVTNPVLEIIEFLVLKSGRCRFEEDQVKQIKFDIEQIRSLFKKYKT